MRSLSLLASVLVVVAAWPIQSLAGTVCRVPEDRPTFFAALIDTDCAEIRLAPGAYPAAFFANRSVDIVGAGIERSYLYTDFPKTTIGVSSPHSLRLEGLTVLAWSPQLFPAIQANNGASLFMNLVSVRSGRPPADGIFADRFQDP
ncbi:MAG: hypothetical protein V2J10_02925 [Wenzhouxiangella sp.]|jgi:hypothetical protein|nr:hypothetical protein [Wenzhouxiangella sp.]